MQRILIIIIKWSWCLTLKEYTASKYNKAKTAVTWVLTPWCFDKQTHCFGLQEVSPSYVLKIMGWLCVSLTGQLEGMWPIRTTVRGWDTSLVWAQKNSKQEVANPGYCTALFRDNLLWCRKSLADTTWIVGSDQKHLWGYRYERVPPPPGLHEPILVQKSSASFPSHGRQRASMTGGSLQCTLLGVAWIIFPAQPPRLNFLARMLTQSNKYSPMPVLSSIIASSRQYN
jgi:hypothetical protein